MNIGMGIHPHLREAVRAIDGWCAKNGIPYDIACDESTLQGLKLFQNDQITISRLLDSIAPIVREHNLHLDTQKVRGGTILALSLGSLSENWMSNFLIRNGEMMEPLTFAERVDHAFRVKPKPAPAPQISIQEQFAETAARLVAPKKKAVKAEAAPAPKPQRALPFEHKVAQVLGTTPSPKPNYFYRSLKEELGGIATPTGAQPGDLFTKFSQALRVLGAQMNIGPLQDRLKEQGINWKKSDDGQNIILYITNATTNAPQPIARISAQTLEKPGDFEEQLKNMLDFAKGDAPGAFQQKQEELRNQESAIRDISKAISPQQSEVAQQMAGGGVQPQAAAPQQPQPQQQPAQQPAVQQNPMPPQQAAAQQAASPKPGM